MKINVVYLNFRFYGNKLLHIFFLVGLAHENKLKLKLPLNASINQVFQTDSNLFSEEISVEDAKFGIENENELIIWLPIQTTEDFSLAVHAV